MPGRLPLRRARAALHHRGADPLFLDDRRLLSFQVSLDDALSDLLLDRAHMIAHIANPTGLEERYERLRIHIVLLGELVNPNFAHSTRSTFTRPIHPHGD
jgi:hypothetical protein